MSAFIRCRCAFFLNQTTNTPHMTTRDAVLSPNKKAANSAKKADIKSFPAHKKLATPTDLKPAEVEAIVDVINPLIADAFALYVKTKNFHWHLASSHFRDYHLLFDKQADAIFESIDPLAERLRRIEATTLRSISHNGGLQRVVDNNEDFVEADDMIQELLDDNRNMAANQRHAIEVCDNHRDTPTGNLLQELLDETERRIWFLYAVSTGGENEL